VPGQPEQQPFHEPIGPSSEYVRSTPIWIVSLLLSIIVLAAGVLVLLRMMGRI
jgi:hypothetical protein